MRIAVLLTCHNRQEKTLACLGALFRCNRPAGIALQVHLVDDGSTDGTADTVGKQYPEVRIVRSDGSLFWCRGTNLAWNHAAKTQPDAFLWLNDDVVLDASALRRLLSVNRAHRTAIVVGSCKSPDRKPSYGGRNLIGRHPGRTVLIPPTENIQRCDTFNGNIVLIPHSAFSTLGYMESYQHGLGDIDYGLSAKRRGIPALVAPSFLGTCSANPALNRWMDHTIPRLSRWRLLCDRKALPPSDWWHFLRRHSSCRAPLYFITPHLRILLGR